MGGKYQRGATPPPVAGSPVVPPFGMRLKGNVRGRGSTLIYLCFQCPRSIAQGFPDSGRLSVSLIQNGLVLAERPLLAEWMRREDALAFLHTCLAEGWRAMKSFGDLGVAPFPTPASEVIDLDSSLGARLVAWDAAASTRVRISA